MARHEPTTSLSEQALECPFCGGFDLRLSNRGRVFRVNCGKCEANGPSANTLDQALKYWNWPEQIDFGKSAGPARGQH